MSEVHQNPTDYQVVAQIGLTIVPLADLAVRPLERGFITPLERTYPATRLITPVGA